MIAILIGLSVSNKRVLQYIVSIAIIMQASLFYFSNGTVSTKNITVLKDTIAGKNLNADRTSNWINSNCDDGLTLISAAGYESILFYSKLDLNHFISEGTGHFWKESLEKPSKHAKCVVFGGSWLDKVKNKMSNNKDFKKNYLLSENYGSMYMYLKKTN